MCKSSLPLTMFAYFLRTDSTLPNSDGPLSTAVPVSTIRAANREVKPVLDYPAWQTGRTICQPSDVMLMGVVNWVTVNQRKFLCEKLFQAFHESFHPRKKPAIRVLHPFYRVARMWLGHLSIWFWNNPFHTFSLPHSQGGVTPIDSAATALSQRSTVKPSE